MTLSFSIPGEPRTKKNSSRIIRFKVGDGYRYAVKPSAQYEEYERNCALTIPSRVRIGIHTPANVKCIYYMPTRRKVDLVNLLEATCDILVKYGVLEDDNSSIVVSHDGSRVSYDKSEPRVEVSIDYELENGE